MAATTKLKRRRDHVSDRPTSSSAQDSSMEQDNSKPEPERASKRPRVDAGRSLFVRSLPPSATAESLTDLFSQHYPVKHATVVVDPATKLSRGYGFVTFTDAADALEAKSKLHNRKIDGRPIRLEMAEARHRKPTAERIDAATAASAAREERQLALAEARKAPKLIVRNLPWSIKTSDQLAALFRGFGKVKYADLPCHRGKLSGFGFVTLRGRKNAQRALDTVNGQSVDGRTLAVDWAVDKETWEAQQNLQPHGDDEVDDAEKDDSEQGSAHEPEGKEDQSNQGDAEEDAEEEAEEEAEEDEDLKNFMKNHLENLEDESSISEGKEDGQEESESSYEIDPLDRADSKPSKPLTTNNSATLFVRNLPFTTTEAELKSHFESFGRVRYARLVMDRATDRPAGTGFVCFAKEQDFQACLNGAPRPRQEALGKRTILQDDMADQQGRYTLQGRVLQLSQAVAKDEAARLTASGAASREGKDKDKRRLFLLSEGIISAGSSLHALLAPNEIKMRDDSTAQRKKLIQGNPSLHLSLTRLAIRNIPRGLTSKELKALARAAVVGFAKDVKEGRREPLSKEEAVRGGAEAKEAEHNRKAKGKGVVKQAKIVFENKEGSKVPEVDGAGRSRGYGFIEYSSHRWALMGLRWLNGHALENQAGKTQRLIVEFAIENANVVARRTGLQVRFQKEELAPYPKEGAGLRPSVQHHKGARGRQPKAGAELKPSAQRDKGARGRHPKEGAEPKPSVQDKKGARGRRAFANREAPIPGVAVSKSGATPEGIPPRQSLDQKIIGRKRVMRKKKADARRS